MDQVVALDHFRVMIREKCERVTGFLLQIVRLSRSIDTDRYGPYSNLLELIQTSFNTPQLGVAGRSPVTSVKNQQHASRRTAVNR